MVRIALSGAVYNICVRRAIPPASSLRLTHIAFTAFRLSFSHIKLIGTVASSRSLLLFAHFCTTHRRSRLVFLPFPSSSFACPGRISVTPPLCSPSFNPLFRLSMAYCRANPFSGSTHANKFAAPGSAEERKGGRM
jgi:hypothetical protein